MPPQRTLIGEISSNRLHGAHLTPYMQGKIIEGSIFGSSPIEVAMGLNCSRSNVRYTLSHKHLRYEGSLQLRDLRRKSYSLVKEYKLLRHVRLHPKNTYKEVKITCDLIYFIATIKRFFKKYNIID
jgi:hypothetical protein